MNSAQTTSAVTSIGIILGSVFSVLVLTGKLSSAEASTLQTALMTMIPAAITIGLAIWKLVPHTDANAVLAAKEVPGASVVVDTAKASPEVTALAVNPAVAGINVKGA